MKFDLYDILFHVYYEKQMYAILYVLKPSLCEPQGFSKVSQKNRKKLYFEDILKCDCN